MATLNQVIFNLFISTIRLENSIPEPISFFFSLPPPPYYVHIGKEDVYDSGA